MEDLVSDELGLIFCSIYYQILFIDIAFYKLYADFN